MTIVIPLLCPDLCRGHSSSKRQRQERTHNVRSAQVRDPGTPLPPCPPRPLPPSSSLALPLCTSFIRSLFVLPFVLSLCAFHTRDTFLRPPFSPVNAYLETPGSTTTRQNDEPVGHGCRACSRSRFFHFEPCLLVLLAIYA